MTNNPHSIRLVIVSSVLVAGNAIAQTHCNEAQGEVTHFSCQVSGTNKVASLCGGYANAEWIQYRFGKIGNVNGAQFPHKFGVDVLKSVRGSGFGFAC